MTRWTNSPADWEIAAYRAADHPKDLWVTIKAPGIGELSKLCSKPHEQRMALALMKHARGVREDRNG